MADGVLSVSGLRFRYPEYHNLKTDYIIDELDLEITPGSISVIFGGAESGKSTLAFILTALIPSHTGGSLSGRVTFDEIDITDARPAEIIDKCGLVFQDPERQTVTTACFDEAAFALESLGVNEKEIAARVENAFKQLQIPYLLDSSTAETSGGEKKKIALAGLIAINPDLWILDETFEELDNPSRSMLFNILKKSGKTVIIFTSKYFDVFRKSDSFYLLEGGGLSLRAGFPFPAGFMKKLKTSGIIPEFSGGKRKSQSKKTSPGKSGGRLLLSAEELRYSYSSGGFSLNIDSFKLHEDEVVSIVGRNGCGKSTLAGILCGLIEPDQGFVSASDGDGTVFPVDAHFLNSFSAFMFQNPDYQIFLPTVREELAFGLKEAGYSPTVVKALVDDAVKKFRLPDADSPPALLSFSVRKRLQAAVYYLLKRPVFILDEADTGMSVKDFVELTERLKKTSRGLIIITHNLELASFVSDRVIGMSGGQIYKDILDSSPEALGRWLSDSGDKIDN